jgi:hypothetical protein
MDESLKSYRNELRWVRFRKYAIISAAIPLLPALFTTPFPYIIMLLLIGTLLCVWMYSQVKKVNRRIHVLKMAIYWRQLELKMKSPDPEDELFQDIKKIF